ncbi:MAG: superoxide dismutase [Bacteroidales bacterium]|jgi:Fe-Mn family superoxide dismutase|nr:superoxide dismutase [Bacteroidales bacterium]
MKTFELPPLPYALNALEPYISEKTLEFHYGKHHKAYVDNLNKLKTGTEFEDASLEAIILNAGSGLFNNAAQVWNHTFYWNCLQPAVKAGESNKPSDELLEAINAKWGSFENFKEEFTKAAVGNFGSGWTWLVTDEKNELEIVSTSNADNPLRSDKEPLLVIDVWEHAYYLDRQNRRPDYVADFWNIVDWEAVGARY